MTYTIAVCTVQKAPDDGQRNCAKHVEFYSKNKFEKLVHLVGFIIRKFRDTRSPERQVESALLNSLSVSVLEHVLVRKSPPPGLLYLYLLKKKFNEFHFFV